MTHSARSALLTRLRNSLLLVLDRCASCGPVTARTAARTAMTPKVTAAWVRNWRQVSQIIG